MQRPAPTGAGRFMHPAHPIHTWPQESLFNRLSRYAMFRPVHLAAAKEALKGVRGIQNPLLAFVGPGEDLGAMQQLMEFLECGEAGALRRMTGVDLLRKEDRRVLSSSTQQHHAFATHLRYCRKCLQLGFHSMLFQHWGVTHCPLHGEALLNGCTGCDQPLVPNVSRILLNPYCCTRCSQLLIKTVVPPRSADSVVLVNRLLADRRRDLQIGEEGWAMQVSVTGVDPPVPTQPALQAVRTRWLHRATAWPAVPTSRWPQFPETQSRLAEGQVPSRLRPTKLYEGVPNVPTDALRRLVDLCAVPHAESLELFAGSWLRIQIITPQYNSFHLSAIAVALHLTLTRYARLRVNYLHMKSSISESVRPFLGVSWNGLHSRFIPSHYGASTGELISMEILGYFALALLYCAGLHSPVMGRQDHDRLNFEDRSFCPSWQLSRDGRQGWIMRMRPRATHTLVRRLIQRYRTTPLKRTVSASAPAGHTLPDVVDLCNGTVPPELLHFPAGVACKP